MFLGCVGKTQLSRKSFENTKKIILSQEGPEEFFYWEMEDSDNLWSDDLGDVTSLIHYRDSLKIALGMTTYNNAVVKESVQNLSKSLLEKEEEDGDRINALLVHTGSVGHIREINYLEAQIINYQMGKYPMFSKPTEFHCFIAKHVKTGKLRAYFGSSDTEWPPHPSIIIKELEKEENSNWKLYRHLHNHYCKVDKNYIGILAPSLADAQYYKMLKERFGVEKVLITNGFNTVEIESKDFNKFESH